MIDLSNIAIIGSGPACIFLLQHILEHIDILKTRIHKISIFEKEKNLGMGMPYNPNTTDIYNRSNISSDEIPKLKESFGDWLRRLSTEKLKEYNINPLPIDDSEVYSRIAIGYYFQEQFNQIISDIRSTGIQVLEHGESEVIDIEEVNVSEIVVTDIYQKSYTFSTIIIATGHLWKEEDHPKAGYYASPWPITKIFPKDNELYDYPVGTLGASLSGFDVVTSLSHRHGEFSYVDCKLKFTKHSNAPNFKIVLHSSRGWLPHLQYEQKEPLREIYRHFNREQLLDLIDDKGFMSIEDFFHSLCRPALILAFTNDKLFDVVHKLQDNDFGFKDFVTLMSEKHEYVNSFEGMKKELKTARNSVYNKIPIHWMETMDDLMYSLNYHSELLAAEDHLFFHKEIISFLMNVIAALPIQSAEILLALYEADSIALKAGKVDVSEESFETNTTKITVTADDGSQENIVYQLFINCSGQNKVDLNDYPFPTLVEKGTVRAATAQFGQSENVEKLLVDIDSEDIIHHKDNISLKISGIDIDSSYRTININGIANDFLYDINFTHTYGLRPYSYGLQACNATSLIVVESWIASIVDAKNISKTIENTTELYEENEDL
ncbi:MAG TPA: FAD/NAD(P)-binding protein [Edaphocola sp.]|nr:FAD/NAD(P)-binding protein [Edaphocola sp.]